MILLAAGKARCLEISNAGRSVAFKHQVSVSVAMSITAHQTGHFNFDIWQCLAGNVYTAMGDNFIACWELPQWGFSFVLKCISSLSTSNLRRAACFACHEVMTSALSR